MLTGPTQSGVPELYLAAVAKGAMPAANLTVAQRDAVFNGPSGTLEVYIGLNYQLKILTWDGNTKEVGSHWEDEDCGMLLNEEADGFCSKCKASSLGTVMTAIMGLITMLPTIQTNIQRSIASMDLNCQKGFAICFSGCFGFIGTMASLMSFSQGCYRNVPTELPSPLQDVKVEASLGPAFICIVLATFFKFFDIFFHLILPTPDECQKDSDKPASPSDVTSDLASDPAKEEGTEVTEAV